MPFMTWATHVLQWLLTERSDTARWSKPHKNSLSSDRRLQPACVKPELLVIADQHAAVNTFPGLVHTARHTMRAGGPEVGSLTARRTPPKVKLVIGVKS